MSRRDRHPVLDAVYKVSLPFVEREQADRGLLLANAHWSLRLPCALATHDGLRDIVPGHAFNNGIVTYGLMGRRPPRIR